mgnify:CR=1 FL=1
MNKKYRITIEKYAQKDIQSIYNYMCDNLVNKEAAIKLLNKINEKFDSIALFPKSAPLLNNDYVTNKNIRKLLIDNYIAFYEVDDINKEIKTLGINLNFAPTVDLYTNHDSQIIGSRSFGEDPEKSGILGAAFAAGSIAAGVIPTVKHFPGLIEKEFRGNSSLSIM